MPPTPGVASRSHGRTPSRHARPVSPTSGSLVVFRHGELFHVRCLSQAEQLRAMEQGARSQDLRTRSAENIARATRVIGVATRPQQCGPGPAITQKPRLALVIVRPGHAATFDWLCRRYGGKVVVIEDRRLRDRRQSGPRQGVRLPGTERRSGGDRRGPLTLSEKHRWREAGYSLVYGGK